MKELNFLEHYNTVLEYNSPIRDHTEEICEALDLEFDNRNYLDLGCGDGSFGRYVRYLGGTCVNVDFAHKRLDLGGGICADINHYDDAGEYDYVSFWDVLEHLERPLEVLHRWSHCVRVASVPIFDRHETHLHVFRDFQHIVEFFRPDFAVKYHEMALLRWEIEE